MPYENINGIDLFYVKSHMEHENKWPLLLIHGAGGSHRHWLNQVQGLQYPIFALDLPGHGRSKGSADDKINVYSSTLLEFARKVSAKGVLLGGHSMGGAIAMTAALEAPEFIKGLVLVDTGSRLKVRQEMLDLFAAGKRMDNFTELVFSKAANKSLKEAAKEEWDNVDPRIFFADFSACNKFDKTKELESIAGTMPVLVVCGEEDIMTPPKYAMMLQERLLGEISLITNAGHMVMLEQPEKLNEVMNDFLWRV